MIYRKVSPAPALCHILHIGIYHFLKLFIKKESEVRRQWSNLLSALSGKIKENAMMLILTA